MSKPKKDAPVVSEQLPVEVPVEAPAEASAPVEVTAEPEPAVAPEVDLKALLASMEAKMAALEAKMAEPPKADPMQAVLEDLAQRAADRDKSTSLVEFQDEGVGKLPPSNGDAADILKSADRKPARVETLPGGMVVEHW